LGTDNLRAFTLCGTPYEAAPMHRIVDPDWITGNASRILAPIEAVGSSRKLLRLHSMRSIATTYVTAGRRQALAHWSPRVDRV
jgi:hypothetical protein